jgi:murein DD-endopeptidase MepM/ murein hydrolase activator NlpD/urea transporter
MTMALALLRQWLAMLLQELALGYAWIALLPSWQAGLLLVPVSFFMPVAGGVGLLGALSAWCAAQLAGADAAERPVAVFNGLLCGLLVAHAWQGGWSLVLLGVLCGVLCGWLSVVMGRLSWSALRLPILSLPFALVAMLCSATGGSLSTLQANAYHAPAALLGGPADAFLSAFGNLYFAPSPLAGLWVLLVLLVFSRYYLVLALLGYGAAALCLGILGAAPEHLVGTAWDSNAMLAALLVGGLFATPAFATAALAMLGAVFAAWMSLALGRVLNVAHLAGYSAPFVLATWLLLYASVRNTRISSLFNTDAPDLPQLSLERNRVARARVGSPGSVGLSLPCMGAWTVSQGFSGEHTHRGLWRHALDFVVLKDGKSFANRGQRVEDFFCYGLPVISPVYGQVWYVVNHVPDNAPGTIHGSDNWGNCVVIRIADGKFVVLAHLKPGSVPVLAGAWLKPGDLLGLCGNSGRSPQPHIHLHVQTAAELGAPTAPFHLISVMLAEAGEAARYHLAVVPRQAALLLPALEGDVRPLYLLAGRGLRYQVTVGAQAPATWSLHAEVDARGRMALVSSRGARCLVESTWAVFACYERNRVADPHFDCWLLACGYTPASTQVDRWQDGCVPARLLAGTCARLWSWLLWPWAAFASSTLERGWDVQAQCWKQTGSHTQKLSGIRVTTRAHMAPQMGCLHLRAEANGLQTVFLATHSFQHADLGVPAWELALNIPALAVPDSHCHQLIKSM